MHQRVFSIIYLFVLLPFVMMFLNGCGPMGMAVGGGATAGVAVAQERSLSDAAKDTRIKIAVGDRIFQKDANMFADVSIKVNEGRVLLTGVVQDPNLRVEAARLTWQVSGVRDVINEIKVENSKGVVGYGKDAFITSQIKTKLTFDKQVKAINYTVETVHGTVYLMGIAQDQNELDRVIDITRNVGSVEDVVSYVRLKSEMPG